MGRLNHEVGASFYRLVLEWFTMQHCAADYALDSKHAWLAFNANEIVKIIARLGTPVLRDSRLLVSKGFASKR